MTQYATIGEAITYPFRKWYRCYNFLWIFTIIGIPSVIGYMIRIIQNLLKGDKQELPKLEFWNDFRNGWLPLGYIILLSFIIGIIFTILMNIHVILYILALIPIALIAPILFIQFAETRKIGDGFDVKRAYSIVMADFKGYIITFIKHIVVTFVFMFAVILLFIGYGASAFGGYYLFVDYYAKNKK